MGAWGFGSFENDTSLDWLSEFESFLTKAIKNKDHDESIAAIEILASASLSWKDLLGNSFPNFDVLDLAHNRLEEVLSDNPWLDLWTHRKEKEKTLEKLKNKLNKLRNRLLADNIANPS